PVSDGDGPLHENPHEGGTEPPRRRLLRPQERTFFRPCAIIPGGGGCERRANDLAPLPREHQRPSRKSPAPPRTPTGDRWRGPNGSFEGPLADAVNGSSIFSLGTRSILMPEVDILKTSPLMTPAAESVMVRKRIGRTGHHVARVFDRFEQGTAPRRQAR